MEKVKAYIYISLAVICIVSAAICWGMPINELSGSGGKSGIFTIVLVVLSTLISPVFENYSISFWYAFMAVLFTFFGYSNIRKIKHVST